MEIIEKYVVDGREFTTREAALNAEAQSDLRKVISRTNLDYAYDSGTDSPMHIGNEVVTSLSSNAKRYIEALQKYLAIKEEQERTGK